MRIDSFINTNKIDELIACSKTPENEQIAKEKLIQELKETKSLITNLLNCRKLKPNPIIWSERMYSLSSEFLNLEKKIDTDEITKFIVENLEQTFNEQVKLTGFSVSGIHEPDTFITLLFCYHRDSINLLLAEKFDSGCLISKFINGSFHTTLLLCTKTNLNKQSTRRSTKIPKSTSTTQLGSYVIDSEKTTEIINYSKSYKNKLTNRSQSGDLTKNNHLGEYEEEEVHYFLDDKLFDNIDYKHRIMAAKYIKRKKLLTANFLLDDGTYKKELYHLAE